MRVQNYSLYFSPESWQESCQREEFKITNGQFKESLKFFSIKKRNSKKKGTHFYICKPSLSPQIATGIQFTFCSNCTCS